MSRKWCPRCAARSEHVKELCATCWPPDLMAGRMPTDSETAGLLDLFGAQRTGEKRAVYGRKTEGEA
jgi:hypothetical protein